MSVKAIPEAYHSITPYLVVTDAAKAMDFYKNVLNAQELLRVPGKDGKIMHAEIKIGDSVVMLADEMPNHDFKSPRSIGGSPISLLLYVENVDQVFARAKEAGAKVIRDLQNQFYGDRSATVEDPFGHIWNLSTHIEDVSPEEMDRRMKELKGGC